MNSSAPASQLEVRDLAKTFDVAGSRGRPETLRVLDGVSFTLAAGRTLGIVGESGSGKSTAARCILRLIEPSNGTITFEGVDVRALSGEALRRFRRHMQIVFQDATGTLDPRMSIGALVEEPLLVHGIGTAAERRDRVLGLLERVGLDPQMAERGPRALSGGQRQRVGIARAIALEPKLIILDEPVSALDVSVQAQILNLLKDLQRDLGLSYVFIVHDLHVAEFFCDEVVVLYLGEVMEAGPAEALFREPRHPYTASLISAVPTGHRRAFRERIVLKGDISPIGGDRPPGCAFRPRCPVGRDRPRCATERPPLAEWAPGHLAACHYPGELAP